MSINIATSLKDLTGQGTEYLVDQDGNIIAKFVDGYLAEKVPVGNDDETVGGQ